MHKTNKKNTALPVKRLQTNDAKLKETNIRMQNHKNKHKVNKTISDNFQKVTTKKNNLCLRGLQQDKTTLNQWEGPLLFDVK